MKLKEIEVVVEPNILPTVKELWDVKLMINNQTSYFRVH